MPLHGQCECLKQLSNPNFSLSSLVSLLSFISLLYVNTLLLFLQLHPTLQALGLELTSYSAHGTSQQEYWSRLPFLPRLSPWPKDGTCISYVSWIGRRFFTTRATWEAHISGYICIYISRYTCVCVYTVEYSIAIIILNKLLLDGSIRIKK